MPGTGMQEELERVRDAYARREREIPLDRYSRFRLAHLCSLHEREQALVGMLREAHVDSLDKLRILDVGCGDGATLRQLLEYKAQPERLVGIDLLEVRLQKARRLAPHLQFVCASALQLPFPDSSFDFVVQFTLFSSVLEPNLRKTLAQEIWRVLTKPGRFLWYDFAYNNPNNPDVRGITRSEIRRLFPNCPMKMRRITLAPPLGRAIARLSPFLYRMFSLARPLCTHYLCLIEKP